LAGDHFTILIFSRDSSKVRRYKIPKLILGSLVLAIPILMVSAFVLGLNYVYNPQHPNLIAEFQQKNRSHHQEIRFFSEKIAELKNQIAQMKEFDSKLRVIANLENQPSSLFGVGGPFLEERRDRMRGQQGPRPAEGPVQSDSALPVSEPDRPESDTSPLRGLLQDTGPQLPHVPSIWPTQGWIVGDFGPRISALTGHLQMHEGIEISNSLGTPILAPAYGLVTTIGTDPDHGKMVVLSHGRGIVTRYGHLGHIDVDIGQKVNKGERIGMMGNTGQAIGPHLYYEVRVSGMSIDPKSFLTD
jgi:murein DD-endopeptidase MepM/ murein hydrolase activator NlpD